MPQINGQQIELKGWQVAQAEPGAGGETPAAGEGTAHTATSGHEGGGHAEHNPLAEHGPEYYSFVGLGIAVLLLAVIGSKAQNPTARNPSKGQLLAEQMVASMRHFCKGIVGAGGERFAPLVGTLFAFILCSNLCGVIPLYWKKGEGMAESFTPAPTANLSMTIALGLIVFVVFNWEGIKANGLGGHLKHFAGPIPALAPLIFPIELIGALVRPISLGMRLFGNVFGEETVIAVLIAMAAATWVIPFHVPMLAFGVFGSIVQAGVFAILTCSYISLSIGDHGHDDHGHEHGEDSHGAAHAH